MGTKTYVPEFQDDVSADDVAEIVGEFYAGSFQAAPDLFLPGCVNWIDEETNKPVLTKVRTYLLSPCQYPPETG